jgi:hypothetical protein
MPELRIDMVGIRYTTGLLTVRWFDLEAVVEPSKTQRVGCTNMDLRLGDQAFQQLRMSAGPRNGMKMRIKLTRRI